MKTPTLKLKKIILIYGLLPMQLQMLQLICQREEITVRAVPDSQTDYTVGELLLSPVLPDKIPRSVDGKFALLSGFGGQEQIGTALINQVSSGVIKAVHTVHNNNWPFRDLCAAIGEEHRMMQQGRK